MARNDFSHVLLRSVETFFWIRLFWSCFRLTSHWHVAQQLMTVQFMRSAWASVHGGLCMSVKVSLWTPWRHMGRRVGVQVHHFLTSVLGAGEWLT